MGSTVNLTNPTGAVLVSYILDPWGHIRRQNGFSINRHIFTGQEHDENTGLIYFGARYYDPDIARLITQDTYLGENDTPPSLHRYLYAYSNPASYIDKDGREPISIAIAIGLAIGATYDYITSREQREEAYEQIQPKSYLGTLATEAYAFSQSVAQVLLLLVLLPPQLLPGLFTPGLAVAGHLLLRALVLLLVAHAMQPSGSAPRPYPSHRGRR